MFKKLWFQTHWLIGITAGIVLAVIGVTGATLSFERDLLRLLNPGVMTVTPGIGGVLPPAELMARVRAAHAEKRITLLTVSSDPTDAARIGFAAKPSADAKNGTRSKRGEMRYLNPYNGELLGKPRGEEFFRLMTQIHRYLAAGDTGKAIVGASTIGLLILCLSGLYLRWPRHASNWRTWLTFDFKRAGRGFLWDLHSVVGTWALALYLLAGLTGLYWSYDWYRDGLFALTGAPRPAQQGMARDAKAQIPPLAALRNAASESAASPTPDGEPTRKRTGRDQSAQAPNTDTAVVWSAFQREVPAFKTVTVRLPEKVGQAVQIQYLDPQAAHERASNRLLLDPTSGAIVEHERYADKPAGSKLMSSMFALHSGSFFGLPGLILMMLASLIMPLFTITGWMLYLERRKNKKAIRDARRQAPASQTPASIPASPGASIQEMLIAFASQTGLAEQLAWQTAGSLRRAGVPVTVEPLSRVTVDALSRFKHALFVVSTFGEGEPPDQARPFARLMRQSHKLNDLRYGVLALGDRQYQTFCGFGRTLDDWLRQHGAQAFFDRIDVDRGDPGALHNWNGHLGLLTGMSAAVPTALALDQNLNAGWERWQLSERRLLNAGSCGNPVFHVALSAPDTASSQWQAGDLVEIRPRNAASEVARVLAKFNLDGKALVDVSIHPAMFRDTAGAANRGAIEPLSEALARSVLPPQADIAGWAGATSVQELITRLQPLPTRQYSIGSLPEDGGVHLLIRQVQCDGQYGTGSGWLTHYAPIGCEIEMRLRRNAGFRLPSSERPLICIGNGTGIAGLRSHLKARVKDGQSRNWLIFGERNAAHDFLYRDEIEAWQKQGMLQRVDLAFSRDQPARVYVQDLVRAAAKPIRDWLEDGAAILICGSLEGMAPGVEAALIEIVGTDAIDTLIAEGRYLRDVY